jgi:hypothetical protein
MKLDRAAVNITAGLSSHLAGEAARRAKASRRDFCRRTEDGEYNDYL